MKRGWAAIALVALLHATPASGNHAGETGVDYRDQTLIVTAGAPGSLHITTNPGGGGGGGPTIRCGWFEVVVGGERPISIVDAVHPVEGDTYLLNCWISDPTEPITDYPIAAAYPGDRTLPGPAVSTAEAARFAVDHIRFAQPAATLSPPGRQIVGVPTWLAVTSRLDYDPVSAQAGPVWATVRPEFREVVWDLGNGDSLTCTADAATTWSAIPSRTSACRYVFGVGVDAPLAASATVRWTIHQLTNASRGAWEVWGTVAVTTPVPIDVHDLQAAIRWASQRTQ